jgi:hypothetical protein
MAADNVDRPDEAFAIEPLDMTPIGPIDDDPKPDPKPDLVKKELAKLAFAPPMKDELKAGHYFEVVQALDKEKLTADEANNLGCAWAWLAHRDGEVDYWRSAIEALKKGIDAPKNGMERKERAERNLKHVRAALKATGAPK